MKEEINAMKSQEVNFQKSQKLLASRAEFEADNSPYGVLGNPPLKLNE